MTADPAARRSFGPTVLLGLSAAALATVGAGRGWAEATTTAQGRRTTTAMGTDVAAGALPLALVALACWGAFLVLRSRGRRVVAGLGLLAVIGCVAAVLGEVRRATRVAVEQLGSPSDVTVATSAWPWVTVAAGAVAAGAFVVALVRAPRWPEMSARYDAPTAPRRPEAMSDAELWRALDDGQDPTT